MFKYWYVNKPALKGHSYQKQTDILEMINLNKCIIIGMRKEWIRSEEEKKIKRMQLEKNRNIKQSNRSVQVN